MRLSSGRMARPKSSCAQSTHAAECHSELFTSTPSISNSTARTPPSRASSIDGALFCARSRAEDTPTRGRTPHRLDLDFMLLRSPTLVPWLVCARLVASARLRRGLERPEEGETGTDGYERMSLVPTFSCGSECCDSAD